jgi:tetratricopeptide (TPR) repeat protein
MLSEYDRAIEAAEGARAIAEGVGDLRLRVVASYCRGLALAWAGDLRPAAEALRATIALVEGAPAGERFGMAAPPAATARTELARVMADMGEFTEAVAIGEEGLGVAQAAGQLLSEILASDHLGFIHFSQGSFAAATPMLERSLALYRATEIRVALPLAAACLSCAYLRSGRMADAVPLLGEATEATTAMGLRKSDPEVIWYLAEAYLVSGQIAEARKQAELCVTLARAHRAQGSEAYGLKVLGDVHAHEPAEAEQAGGMYRQALAIATELGMRPLVAHCHLGLGTLYQRTGKREQAREHLTTATAMYREMEMRFWLEQAEAEIGQLA